MEGFIFPRPLQSIIVKYVMHEMDIEMPVVCIGESLETIKWYHNIFNITKTYVVDTCLFEWFLMRHTPEIVEWFINEYSLTRSDCVKLIDHNGNNYFTMMCTNNAKLETIQWYLEYFNITKLECLGDCNVILWNGNLPSILSNHQILTMLKNRFNITITDFDYCKFWFERHAFTEKFNVVEFLKWIKINYNSIDLGLPPNYWAFRSIQINDVNSLTWLLNELKPNDYKLAGIRRILRGKYWDEKIITRDSLKKLYRG